MPCSDPLCKFCFTDNNKCDKCLDQAGKPGLILVKDNVTGRCKPSSWPPPIAKPPRNRPPPPDGIARAPPPFNANLKNKYVIEFTAVLPGKSLSTFSSSDKTTYLSDVRWDVFNGLSNDLLLESWFDTIPLTCRGCPMYSWEFINVTALAISAQSRCNVLSLAYVRGNLIVHTICLLRHILAAKAAIQWFSHKLVNGGLRFQQTFPGAIVNKRSIYT